jgi:hypothetical protein
MVVAPESEIFTGEAASFGRAVIHEHMALLFTAIIVCGWLDASPVMTCLVAPPAAFLAFYAMTLSRVISLTRPFALFLRLHAVPSTATFHTAFLAQLCAMDAFACVVSDLALCAILEAIEFRAIYFRGARMRL